MSRARFAPAALLLVAAACTSEPIYPSHAPDLYAQFCASCHGVTGRGDGHVAGALTTPPADLTRSTAGIAELMRIIDGRRTVRAHGTSEMPVWGQIFVEAREGDPRQHRQALRDVQALAEYVRSLRAAAR